jgi:two-component system, LytTR family, response regulator
MQTIPSNPIFSPSSDILNRIYLPTNRGIEIILVNDIIRIQSSSNYSKLYFSNGKTLVVAKVLRWFEEQLHQYHFVRIHRTHLVNMNYMQSYQKNDGGQLLLHNGESIKVAKRKKAALIRSMIAA